MTEPQHDLDDPDYAAFAWGRFRRLFAWMAYASLAAAIGAVGALWWWLGDMTLHMGLATAAGVFLSMLLAAALMGLMFLSSGSGHDTRIDSGVGDDR